MKIIHIAAITVLMATGAWAGIIPSSIPPDDSISTPKIKNLAVTGPKMGFGVVPTSGATMTGGIRFSTVTPSVGISSTGVTFEDGSLMNKAPEAAVKYYTLFVSSGPGMGAQYEGNVSSVVNQAIATLGTLNPPGGSIICSAGTWDCNGGTIHLATGVAIIGQGAATIFRGTDTTIFDLALGSVVKDATLENLTIENVNTGGDFFALDTWMGASDGYDKITLRKVTIRPEGAGARGIRDYAIPAKNLGIIDCTLDDVNAMGEGSESTNAIAFFEGTDILVKDTTLKLARMFVALGVGANEGENSIFSRNKFTVGNGNYFLYINGANRSIIDSNQFIAVSTRATTGIWIAGNTSGLAIGGVNQFKNYGVGVQIQSLNNYTDIHGNLFVSCSTGVTDNGTGTRMRDNEGISGEMLPDTDMNPAYRIKTSTAGMTPLSSFAVFATTVIPAGTTLTIRPPVSVLYSVIATAMNELSNSQVFLQNITATTFDLRNADGVSSTSATWQALGR